MVLTIRPARAGDNEDPGRSRTAERLAVRRTAMPMFLARGYGTVTVDDLTDAAGISRRTFFRLFGGKHEIVSCDQEVFHLELHTHLLQHQAERTIVRAARAVALVVDGLTVVPEETADRDGLVASDGALQAEENRWFARHQSLLATFLTEPSSPRTSIAAEMTAASIIAAARTAVRDYINAPDVTANVRFQEAVESLNTSETGRARQLAVIETSLPIDELLARINDPYR